MSNSRMARLNDFLGQAAYWIREYFGENDYPRYLAAWQADHDGRPADVAHQPLNAREFFAQRIEVRFGGNIQRC